MFISFIQTKLLHGLWNLEVQCRFHKGSPIIPILNWINPIPRIDIYFLRSILILSSHIPQGPPNGLFPVGLPVRILKTLLHSSILAAWTAHLNLPYSDSYTIYTITIIHYILFIPLHNSPLRARACQPDDGLTFTSPEKEVNNILYKAECLYLFKIGGITYVGTWFHIQNHIGGNFQCRSFDFYGRYNCNSRPGFIISL